VADLRGELGGLQPLRWLLKVGESKGGERERKRERRKKMKEEGKGRGRNKKVKRKKRI
jgi:hypothetical protein